MTIDEFREVGHSSELGTNQKKLLRHAIVGSALGNAVEWYDYAIYAFMAGIMGSVFFADETRTVQLIATYGVFAISFLARPIGGIVFGVIGDRIGRRRVLVLSVLLMTLGTTLIGVLPSSSTIGLWAPLLLIILRLVQGFATGGEYSGAATLMTEFSPIKQRGFYSSFLEFSTNAGYQIGLGVITLFTFALGSDAMNAWGWRVPFLLALPVGAVGLYMRLRLEETPVFREAERAGQIRRAGAKRGEALRSSLRSMAVLFGLVLMLNLVLYTVGGYMPQYLEGPLGLSAEQTTLLLLVFQLSAFIFIPLSGALSDRIGRRPCWYISAGGFIVLTIPAFLLMQQGVGWAVCGLLIMSVLISLQRGVVAATLPSLFPTVIRYTGFALGYNVATSLFGGTAPLVSTAMIDFTGSKLFPAFYVMAACVIGLIAALRMRETAGLSLRDTGVESAMRKRPISPTKD